VTEPETLESIAEEESEILPEEVAELQYLMQSKIAEAVALGVFTDKEARAWEEGFEACDRLEYMENLVEMVDDFISSGLEIVEQITATLETDLLNEREKTRWQIQMEMLSFQDKCELLQKLTEILRQVSHYKQQLIQLLKMKRVSPVREEEWLKTFAAAEAEHKEGVVTRAALEVADSPQNLDVQSLVSALITAKQFSAARKILSENQLLVYGEYARLMNEVDAAEISQARQLAQST